MTKCQVYEEIVDRIKLNNKIKKEALVTGSDKYDEYYITSYIEKGFVGRGKCSTYDCS